MDQMVGAARIWVADAMETRTSVLVAAILVGGVVTLGAVLLGGAGVVWWAVGG